MKISVFKYAFVALVLFIQIIFAQDKTVIDTTRTFNFAVPQEISDLQLSSVYIFENQHFNFSPKLLNDTNSVWLRTRMMLTGIGGEENPLTNSPTSMLNPLYNKYLESQKFSALKTILGSVQVGAVSYLAYKHLKKYGLLKKK